LLWGEPGRLKVLFVAGSERGLFVEKSPSCLRG
jgi:hypothetical protein